MNSWKMDEHWTFKGGFRQAQWAPTLTERYADGLFLSIARTGYNHVYGDPTLSPEQLADRLRDQRRLRPFAPRPTCFSRG